jgi:hypothetical protein
MNFKGRHGKLFLSGLMFMVLISRYWAMVGRDMLTIPAPKDHRNMPATTVHNTMLLFLFVSTSFSNYPSSCIFL